MSVSLYDPSPVQQEFHLCTADEALLGGAAGPGKSFALLMDPIQTQLIDEAERVRNGEIASSVGKAIHFRREFPMLTDTLDRAHRLFPKIDPKVHWDGDLRTFTFSCGYKYQFAHLKEKGDWRIYDSNEYTHIGFDELVQFEHDQYRYVSTRCRTSDPVLMKKLRVRGATNPGPGWVREYFVDPAPNGRVLLATKIRLDEGGERIRTRIFIPARLKDNPNADFRADYESRLKAELPHIRQARLYGDWYVVVGAFFAEEWMPALHVVEPYKIPPGCTRFRSMDWGYKNWGAVHWWAVDSDDNLDCYRELSFRKMDAAELADAVRATERANDEWDERRDCSKLTGPADYQIWEQRGTIGPTIAETMSSRGVWWEKCTKNRLAATQQLLRRLKSRGHGDRPGIRFHSDCKKAIQTIPSVQTDEANPEVPKDGGDDHWLDSVLYACMYRAATPESNEGPVRRRRDEWDDSRSSRPRRMIRSGRYGYGGF